MGRELDDQHLPHQTLVDRILGQLDEGAFTFIPLSVVLSADTRDSGDLQALTLDGQGRLSLKRRRPDRAMPEDSEALRGRLRVLGFAWEMARLSHPGRPCLASCTRGNSEEYIDHLLSERVLEFKTPALGGVQGWPRPSSSCCSTTRPCATGRPGL